MAPDESQESFKVTDRRRRGDDESPAPRATPASAPSPPPAPPPAPSPPPLPPAADADPDRNLVGLFMMLGSSALMALGETDPATGQRGQRDLPMAAEVIDVLALLREKTDGRRSADETNVLEELLYDLQLRYVNATKRPG